MDDQVAEDDGYSDDDLDALPDNAFHELQQNAIRSTQHPHAEFQLPSINQFSRPEPIGLAGGFGRLSVASAAGSASKKNGLQQPSSDYGDFDDEMLDGEIFDAAEQPYLAAQYENHSVGHQVGKSTQREQWRRQRYSGPSPRRGTQSPNAKPQAAPYLPVANRGSYSDQNDSLQGRTSSYAVNRVPSVVPPQEFPNIDVLQAQIQKLLSEREALQLAIQSANDNAFSKAGEIAIVRANASKVEKEFEDRTKALQKLHADEAARQKIEVEKVRAELQKIATEKDFLEHDLADGTKQIKNLQKAIQKGSGKGPQSKISDKENQPTTPKKNNSLPYGDGFEDDEIQTVSPSKLAIRSKTLTPRAGTKRKRKPTESSPLQPLELAQPKNVESFEEINEDQRNHMPQSFDEIPRRQDQKFQLTQKILNHRFEPDQPRTFERFASFAFPSKLDQPLSTLFLDKMSALTFKPDTETFPAAVGLVLVSLWSQCMDEGYHQPVHLLVDLVKLVLVLNPIKTAPDLTNDLMGLVQLTADVILIPRCKKLPARKDRADIDSTECLQIIEMMAYDCQCDTEEIVRFWRTMRFDFIMMLLNFINPLREIQIMLRLLRTSILEQSFAMVVPPNNGQQDASEAHILDNLSHLLINTPRPVPGEDPPDAVKLCEVRFEVLSLIEAMCDNDHCAEALAKHRLIIGCLVRVMNDELDRIYDYQYGHEQRVALVNTSTRLLYHLTSNYPHLINIQSRLSVVPGGEKKFLIVLTRLAFSEGGFYEQGIEDDVVDCAHQMLEARVSPEEAEQLVEAFSSTPVNKH